MKTKLIFMALTLLALSTLNPQLSTVFAQGTAFTYQGFLTDQGAPAHGSNDLTFTLFNAVSGGATVGTSNVVNDLAISNGLFTVTLDYGAGIFTGADRWLQIAVRPGDNSGAYTNVNPRQKITPTPYAIFAGSSSNISGTLSGNGLSGVYSNALTFTNGGNVFRGTFTGNGAGVTNVNAATLGGVSAGRFWKLDGNNVSNGDILGSTNNQVVQLVANGFNALRLEPNSMALPNVVGGSGSAIAAGVYGANIGGGFANSIETNANEAVIAGGAFNNIGNNSANAFIGGGQNNKIQTNCYAAAIVGGESDVIESNSFYAFIGGGGQNSLQGNNSYSTIGGGNGNTLQIGVSYGFIGGGRNNTSGAAAAATIAGGENNTILPGADRGTIGGGLKNFVTGGNGTVPGGFSNSASIFAFAAGRRAKANNTGSFVWADTTDADLVSVANNSVTMRAAGGYFLYSTAGTTLGVTVAANGTSWGALCDRNAKKNFAPADPGEILEKLAAIPVQWWNYKLESDDAVKNLGPMAQDFKAAFYPGRDDKIITTLEFDGVELAAIQGLNEKVEARSQKLEAENAELKAQLAELKVLVKQLAQERK